MRRTTFFVLFILSLIGLTGCRSKTTFGINQEQIYDTRTVIEQTIEEPERRAALLQIIDAYKADVSKIEAEAVKLRQDISNLNRDFEAPREELEVRYDELGKLTAEFCDIVAKYSLQAKALCSEAEWKKIAPKKVDPFSFSL